LEYTERVTYECTVNASSKREAIALVKACEYDVNDLMCGSMPYAIRVVRTEGEK
jgi:hypothetical protein